MKKFRKKNPLVVHRMKKEEFVKLRRNTSESTEETNLIDLDKILKLTTTIS
jgi:hypothetical protein